MILTRSEMAQKCLELKSSGKKIVFTNGCFDIIHSGHVTYLAQARSLGDVLVVGMNTDDSVRRLKGPTRPVNNENDRSIVLSALKSVDYVTLFNEDTPYELISLLKPDVLAKGGDYTLENVVGREVVEGRGGRLVLVPFLPGHSTSVIVERIRMERGVTV